MKTRILTLMLLLVTVCISAQEIIVSGTVNDTDGFPVEDASVMVVETGEEVYTDADGNYTISAEKGQTLEITYLGFDAVKTIVDGNTVNVSLRQGEIELEGVVSIGYGTADKRDLTGSIAQVDGDVVADKPAANPIASLQGRVAGLSIVNTGQMGGNPDVRIRGTSSRYNTQPLYVVDGLWTDDINYLNPNDIESIEVLKDASSLAIFGVRGANGVIIVTTKEGLKGKLSINYNSSIGYKKITNRPDMANAALFKELYDETLANQGLAPYQFYDIYNGDTDWVDEIEDKSSFLQTHNLTIQSATDKNKFSLGFGYREEDGLAINERLQRLTLNLNNEYKMYDNFTVGINFHALKDDLPNFSSFTSALNATPIVDPIHYDNREGEEYIGYNGTYNQLPIGLGDTQIGNPLLVNDFIKTKSITDRYRFNGNVYAELKFLKNFKFRSTFYGDYQTLNSRSYTPIINIYVGESDELTPFNGTQLTSVSQGTNRYMNFQQEHLLTYEKDFGDHDLTLTAGYTTQYFKQESLSGSVKHNPTVGIIPDDPRFWYVGVFPFGDPLTQTNSSTQYARSTVSFLGRMLYNYKEKYLINASYRRDATSQLAPDNRAQDFWAVGAGWVVTKENFLNSSKTLDFLKLKGSIGKLGNQYVPENYPYYPGVNEGATAVFGGLDLNGDGYPDYEGDVYNGYIKRFEENPDLKWEDILSWEAGFESKWFNNRLTLDAVYYNRKTSNLLVFIDTGVEQFFENSGEIENKGFEVSASWADNLGDNFEYGFGGNITTVNNKVLSTYEDAAIFSGPARTITGEPIGSFYGYIVDGVYQTNAQIAELPASTLGNYAPGDLIFRDINKDGVIDEKDRTNIGNPTPDFYYGFYTHVKYKNVYLDMDFQGVYGNEVYRDWGNGSSFAAFNYREARADRWNGQGTSNWEPRLNDASAYNRNASTYMIEDGSYFRIRNIQLGYQFKPFFINKLQIQQMKLYLNVENVYTWTDVSGFTPEAGGSPVEFGVDRGGYPLPMITTFGLNITF